MLHDPRHDKALTLASFALFVASKDPNESYSWANRCACAVGQWLTSMGLDVHQETYWIGEAAAANTLANGIDAERTFGKLADRILAYQIKQQR